MRGLNDKELSFEAASIASSSGVINIISMVGAIPIYKYLDLAGNGTTWGVTFDGAPDALHE